MGNDNSQITFPIEGNNHQSKIKINSKRIKHKEPSNNTNKINCKQKNNKIQKIQKKNYIVPRISTTPDRNINIPGMDKNSNNTKRYVSYEKTLKAQQNNDNKINHKKIDLNINKNIKTKNKFIKNMSILYISNFLNNIYSSEIDNKLNKTNELHLGNQSLIFNNKINSNNNRNHNKNISQMFDSIFKYNYFFKNIIKPIRIKSISKNNNNNLKPLGESINKHQRENKINNYKININYKENKQENNKEKINNIVNIKTNNRNINQNTTLEFNKLDIDSEVISVNNKKKNHNNYNIIPNNNKISKKYSESRYINESETSFISSEEINVLNNIQKIDTNKIKPKEEDASESQTQTDKQQEIINHNIANKNKINNNNYFVNNAQVYLKNNNNKNYILKNLQGNIVYNNEKKYENKIDKNKINNKENKNINININQEDTIKSKIMEKDDEIILSNNESQNSTYLEILLAMNENKNESIINHIKNDYLSNKNKNLNHKKIETNKLNEIKRKKINAHINATIKREITPPNLINKRLTLNKPLNRVPKNNNANINNKIINKTKKITPVKTLTININNNATDTKTNFYTKNYCSNNSNYNSNNAIKQSNSNTINFNNVYSPKKIKGNSLSKKKVNSSNNINFSSNKKLDYKVNDKSRKNNNNSPIQILNYNKNINGTQNINNLKNEKNSDSISPSNSPEPSPTNNFNNNYKDRYTYKKMNLVNNSLRKKINDTNNVSNQCSINASNNNYIQGNDKSSALYSKINTNNTTKRTNYNYANNKKIFRNSGNKNKIIFFKKERLSGNSFDNKIPSSKEVIEVEPRTKSNDQKYSVYNSKIVLAPPKKKVKL